MENPFKSLHGRLNTLDRLLLSIDTKLKPILNSNSANFEDKPSPQKFGNAKDAGERYGVHPNTVRNWARSSFIKKHIVEGVSLYSFEEIDAFIKSKAS